MNYLGIDLGGTNIACAVVSEMGEILGKASIPTGLPCAAEVIADRIAECCRLAAEKAGISMTEIEAAGIGAPGIADSKTGEVVYSCNLGFSHTPLGSLVSERLGMEVFVENDANAAALGEYAAGCGRGYSSLVAITLGTGVGGGAVIDGKILTGFNFAGGEMGHFVMVHNGELCGCGRRGCFEAYCSATALIRQTKKAMQAHPESSMWRKVPGIDRVDGRTSFDAMAEGDAAAAEVVSKYREYLADGLTSIINIFQPEILCVGGGICNQGEVLLGPIREIIDREDYARDCEKRTKLVRAELGNDAGIIGAAMLPKYR